MDTAQEMVRLLVRDTKVRKLVLELRDQVSKVDKIMNQTDLAATLLGQLGLEHTAFTFSRNVLGSDYKYPFAFYSFNNGFSFRDSTGVTVFDNNSGSILFDEPEADESRLDKGKAILQTVYDDLGNR